MASMSEWQPIETAPRDGTLVWVYAPDERIPQGAAYWEFGERAAREKIEIGSSNDMRMWTAVAFGGRATEWGDQLYVRCTHWMPLPPPPEGDT